MQQTITSRSIMNDFAESTGLTDISLEPRRYLWTDAFAVCNYLELYRQSGEQKDLHLAFKLVGQVHQTLGKHHKDSQRSGWLSGLDDEEAQQHPTVAGLRIGKKLNERQVDEPYDDQLEWDRDGQYFHYLTKWMHALNLVAQVSNKSIYSQWAVELAQATHSGFTHTARDGSKRMYWKMSIDLSRPLVEPMGHHDPLDGLITYQQLEATIRKFSEAPTGLNLKTEIKDMISMCDGRSWATEDALGIGGLLTDAYRLTQLIGVYDQHKTIRLDALLHDIERSLESFVMHNLLSLPANHRLAFRELGLAIGLQTINKIQKIIEQHPNNFLNTDQLNPILSRLSHYHHIHKHIESFWLKPEHRTVNTWQDHADINNVMLATCLSPMRLPEN